MINTQRKLKSSSGSLATMPLTLSIVSNAKCRICLFLLLGVWSVKIMWNLHLTFSCKVHLLLSFGTSSWMLLVGRSLISLILRASLIPSWWVTLSGGTKRQFGWLLFVLSSEPYGRSEISGCFKTLILLLLLFGTLFYLLLFYWCKTGHPFKNYSLSFLVSNWFLFL